MPGLLQRGRAHRPEGAVIASLGAMTGRPTTKSTSGPRSAGRLQRAIDATVRREITKALRESEGNMAEAARRLGITYMALYKRLRALGISADSYRQG